MTKELWIFEIASEWEDDKGVGVVWILPNGSIQHGRYRAATQAEIDEAAGVAELREQNDELLASLKEMNSLYNHVVEEVEGLKGYIAETEERGRQSVAQTMVER